VAMDDAHVSTALRYVSLNPVRARLVERADDWAWSSARAHLSGRDDGLVRVAPLLDRIGRFANLIEADSCPRQAASTAYACLELASSMQTRQTVCEAAARHDSTEAQCVKISLCSKKAHFIQKGDL
jgi:hypothetical protein